MAEIGGYRAFELPKTKACLERVLGHGAELSSCRADLLNRRLGESPLVLKIW